MHYHPTENRYLTTIELMTHSTHSFTIDITADNDRRNSVMLLQTIKHKLANWLSTGEISKTNVTHTSTREAHETFARGARFTINQITYMVGCARGHWALFDRSTGQALFDQTAESLAELADRLHANFPHATLVKNVQQAGNVVAEWPGLSACTMEMEIIDDDYDGDRCSECEEDMTDCNCDD